MAQVKASERMEDAHRCRGIPEHICIVPPGPHFLLAALAIAG